MTTEQSAALLRHRLRAVLKAARTDKGLTQRDVADELGWSASKIIRIEQGDVGLTKADLKALLDTYDLATRFDELAVWARDSRKRPWAEHTVLTPEAKRYFGYEASASIVRSFEPHVVPGLLQTDDYARAILHNVYGCTQHEVEQHVDVRRARRTALGESPESPEAFFIMGEAVVRSLVGGADAMRQQLTHLTEMAALPKVTIQIVPFAAGEHFGMRGPFVYLEFPAEDDRDVLYLETATGDRIYLDDPGAIGPYKLGFQALERIATPPKEALASLQRYIDVIR